LQALEVYADRERLMFFERHGAAIETLVDRGTYLDEADARELTDKMIPGMDELAALLTVMRLAGRFDGRILVDTAPTGHTLRLLELPRVAIGWLEALEAMQAKHDAIATALVGRSASDPATEFLRTLRDDIDQLSALFEDSVATRFVLVTTSEPVVLAETRRYRERLESMGIAPGGIVVNRQAGQPSGDAIGPGMVYVPPVAGDLTGPDGLRRFSRCATIDPRAADPAVAETGHSGLHVGAPYRPPLNRRMYLVGGKGGVGKSTAAAALAVRVADEGGRHVLLLSVDPAGSLSEVLGRPVDSEAAPVEGVGGLRAQQLDAEAAWLEFRRQYQEEVDQLFTGLLPGGASATMDRAVVERLVDLAPPGIDELMALMEVIDLTEDAVYDALVLDTAPTGHLLRLLELPDLALDWAHAVLRLLLKYREAISLGGLGERVLKLSRSLRALRDCLRDDERTFFLAVALPESLSISETARLLPRLGGLGIRPGALLVNRSLLSGDGVLPAALGEARRLAAIDPAVRVAGAPLLEEAPHSIAGLRTFIEEWRELDLAPRIPETEETDVG
ncbi:MAG: ArsA family ATPase, partial [Gemmatimonadota bacterium]